MKPGYAPSASVLIALFLLLAAPGSVRADHVLVADGPSQNLESVAQIYSTSMAQPAMASLLWTGEHYRKWRDCDNLRWARTSIHHR